MERPARLALENSIQIKLVAYKKIANFKHPLTGVKRLVDVSEAKQIGNDRTVWKYVLKSSGAHAALGPNVGREHLQMRAWNNTYPTCAPFGKLCFTSARGRYVRGAVHRSIGSANNNRKLARRAERALGRAASAGRGEAVGTEYVSFRSLTRTPPRPGVQTRRPLSELPSGKPTVNGVGKLLAGNFRLWRGL
ncbi:hypothetical protein EVAR_64346_1 [Eumeta japonica]|uniref:Uncharacterized protein n=1 Tax=Eumeta variegata TaxID=151549 RepID=A0A4C1ZKA0_EUMVA|nr:hypothetical protein EVAR_64346_1 [Eumeta japonica]